MINSVKSAFIPAFLFLFSWPSGHSPCAIDSEALKVLRLIEKIGTEPPPPADAPLRRAEVNENELNAYIAHRIEAENEEIMKELALKLMAGNRVEGRVFVDLSGRKIPAGLRPRMTLYFSATMQAKDQKVRLILESLYLDRQKIQPALLDLILFVVAQLEQSDPVGIEDWIDLPYGIKNLKTEVGKLIVEY